MSLKSKIKNWLFQKESKSNNAQPDLPPCPQELTEDEALQAFDLWSSTYYGHRLEWKEWCRQNNFIIPKFTTREIHLTDQKQDQYLPDSDPGIIRLAKYIPEINAVITTACNIVKQDFGLADIHKITNVDFTINPPTKTGRPPKVFEKVTIAKNNIVGDALYSGLSLDPTGNILGINVTVWKSHGRKSLGMTVSTGANDGNIQVTKITMLDSDGGKTVVYDKPKTKKPKTNKSRVHEIKDDEERAALLPASQKYIQSIVKNKYRSFPETPFISEYREKFTQWKKHMDDPVMPTKTVLRERMIRNNGLLPGDIYLLYWVDKFGMSRKIPLYFEFDFGIDFVKEYEMLLKNNYISKDGITLTSKGKAVLNERFEIVKDWNEGRK